MKCSQALEEMMNSPATEYSRDLREHLGECEDCRREVEGQDFVRRIMSIKRNEMPTAESGARIAAGVLSELEGASPAKLRRFPRESAGRIWKPLLQTAAAAALIIAGASFYFAGDKEQSEMIAESAPAPTFDGLDLPLTGSRAPEWMRQSTNVAPEEIQYGPLRSRLVDFELEPR
jgi:hypothetical protein